VPDQRCSILQGCTYFVSLLVLLMAVTPGLAADIIPSNKQPSPLGRGKRLST
jgi:hypothetical protein